MTHTTLYTRFRHLRGLMCLVAAEYAGVPVKELDLLFPDQKTPEYLVINPLGQIPSLVSDNVTVTQTTAIMRHISRIGKENTLLGSTPYENSLVDQWFDFINIEFFKPFLAFYMPLLGYSSFDKHLNSQAYSRIEFLTQIIEDALTQNAYLVGQNISVADIFLAALFSPLFRFCLGDSFRAKFPATTKWFVTLFNEPAFRKVLGPAHLCQKAMCPSMFRPPVIIYGKGFNLRVLAIQSLCDVAGLKHETRNFATYDDMKKPEFLAVNPLGQIPAITVGNESVYQTTAILRHIARVGNYTLLGNNLYENAIVDQWCEFFNTEYNKYSVKLAYPIYGHQTFNSEEYQKTRTDFLRISRIIDNQLKGQQYFIGEHITIVDFLFLSSFMGLFRLSLGEDFRKQHPNLTNWFKNISDLDYIRFNFGLPHLCQNTLVHPAGFKSK